MMVALCFRFIRFPRVERQNKCFICASASAAGGSRSDNDLNPYEVIFDNSRFCSMMLWNCYEHGGVVLFFELFLGLCVSGSWCESHRGV